MNNTITELWHQYDACRAKSTAAYNDLSAITEERARRVGNPDTTAAMMDAYDTLVSELKTIYRGKQIRTVAAADRLDRAITAARAKTA